MFFILLMACKGAFDSSYPDSLADSLGDSSDSSVALPPLTSELTTWAYLEDDAFPNAYAVGGTEAGILVTLPNQEAVYRVPWGTIGESIESQEIAVSYPGGADAIRTVNGSVNIGFGVMGAGLALYFRDGINGLNLTHSDADIQIRGTVEGGYTSRAFVDDFNGDGADDIAVVEGSVPGYVRVFFDADSLSGDYAADEADITLETCARSSGYGPTFVQRWADWVAVGCASRNFQGGPVYVFDWPLTDGAEDVGYYEELGGWYGASDGSVLYSDVRGGGVLAVVNESGDGTYVYPDSSSSRFGAQPVVESAGGRTYLAVGDQSYDSEGNISGRVTVCDITEEPTPVESWFADCVYLTPPVESGLLWIGASVDIDASGDALLVSASGWRYSASESSGVVGWRVNR